MDEKELEKTKPIEVLKDITNSMDDYETLEKASRESKYKENNYDESIEEGSKAEEAEEALAEKNIALAEAYLKEENEDHSGSSKEKVKLIDKIKNKWHSLSKKQKIACMIIALIILITIIVGIVSLLTKEKKVEEQEEQPPVETAPVITDNFYYKDGNLYFLDEQENEIGSYTCENKKEELCYVAINNSRDAFDVAKLETTSGEEKVTRIPIYDNQYVFIVDKENKTDKTIKLYSIKDNKVEETYNDVKAYEDNYVIVSNNEDKYSLLKIENSITEMIKPNYTYLGKIEKEENLIAKNNKGYVIINKDNKVLSATYDNIEEIKYYNDKLIVAKEKGNYNVYDYKKNVIAEGYDFATIIEEYAALINNNKLYIIDSNKNKYSEGTIKLENKNYVKTYIYEEEKLVSTKRSFDMTIQNTDIEIAIYSEDKEDPTYQTISLIEGLISQKYKYVNYFDSKLYFYKDEEKQELLGSYSCSNKNNVTKTSDNFDSCFIAIDTVYEDNDMSPKEEKKSLTPLINEKYIFIMDGPSTIKLYDIEDNKILGTYTSINTYTPNNDYNMTKHNGKLNIVALNKKGQYGMLTIDGKKVSATYTFDYNKMEKIGDYILVEDTNSNWKILFSNNSESAAISGKIQGYSNDFKHLKATTNNLYSVYNEDGNKASTETYNYVELANDYYVGIKDKELFIYDYQGNKLIDTAINLNNTDYKNKNIPSFKVKKNGTSYIISIYDGSKYNNQTAPEVKKTELPPVE